MIVTYLVAILCVLGLAAGQLLFKLSATALSESASLFPLRAAISFVAAMGLYSITSIAWVWVLQKVDLGRVYPLMALAFVLVPLGSHFVFGEKFSEQYVVGVILIALGIVVVSKA